MKSNFPKFETKIVRTTCSIPKKLKKKLKCLTGSHEYFSGINEIIRFAIIDAYLNDPAFDHI